METAIYVILAIVILVIILFRSDRKRLSETITKWGGLKTLFPGFVFYCESPMTLYPDTKMQLVKDSGEYLEYKKTLMEDEKLFGHLHLGIRHSYGTLLYSYFITKDGKKIQGYTKEITHAVGISELSHDDYNTIFESMFQKLVAEKEFQKYLSTFQ